jgi:glutaredoxin
MKKYILLLSLLLIAINVSYAESLYRWVDKSGKVHYGDQPAEDAVQSVRKKFAEPVPAGDDDLPYGIRKAKQDFPVTLYVSDNCGEYCAQARALLNKRGIPYTEKNLADQAAFDAFKAKTGGTGVPSLFVGKTILKGFEAGQWNSELDIAGYPKVAPFGIRPNAPVKTPTENSLDANK